MQRTLNMERSHGRDVKIVWMLPYENPELYDVAAARYQRGKGVCKSGDSEVQTRVVDWLASDAGP